MPATRTLLPLTRVVTYGLPKNSDRMFSTPNEAALYVDKLKANGVTAVNVYRIEKVNGTWRTDWTLCTDGETQ